MWNSQNSVPALDKAVNNILKLADEKALKVIAIPSISSGGYVLFFVVRLLLCHKQHIRLSSAKNFQRDICLRHCARAEHGTFGNGFQRLFQMLSRRTYEPLVFMPHAGVLS
jgi:hypothetical protein